MITKIKKCIQCGQNEKLYKLDSGEYVCKECLDIIGREQKEMKEYISNYLDENWQITNPETQAKVLEALALEIRIENKIIDEEKMKEIIQTKERMEKAFE